MISFKQVDFTHSGQRLFAGLTFHLQKGRYLVISGPARSGKTTLVKMIAGLLGPTAGEIIIDGEAMESILESRTKLRQLRRKVGGVGGIYSLLTELTILENIALSAEIAGLSPRAARKSALEACGKYRLTHLLSQVPDKVSEVERRAALLARAEAARKDLIVADAPTDGLDPQSAAIIHERLAALRLAGVTILYLTSGSGPQNGPDEYLHLHEGKLAP